MGEDIDLAELAEVVYMDALEDNSCTSRQMWEAVVDAISVRVRAACEERERALLDLVSTVADRSCFCVDGFGSPCDPCEANRILTALTAARGQGGRVEGE